MPVLWSRIPESEWHNHESYNPPHEKGNWPFVFAINQLDHFTFSRQLQQARCASSSRLQLASGSDYHSYPRRTEEEMAGLK